MLEEFQIVFRISELRDADAPLDAARHRALLVAGEVDARLLVNKADDLLHRGLADLERRVLRVRDEWMPDEQQQFSRHLRRRQHVIRQASGTRTVRHRAKLCGPFVLHHHSATRFLDRTNAQGGVASRSGKRDANSQFAAIFG